MPKRTTDLLDVFRTSSGDAGASSKKPRATKPSRTKRKSAPARSKSSARPFEGVFLNPRQVLLAACVAVLLVVLAFTVGIGVGRKGSPDDDGLALARQTSGPATAATWWIRGKMPRRGVLRREAVEPEEILSDLVDLHGFRPSDIQVETEKSPRDHWWIYYGPFQSEEQARQVSQTHNLAYKRVGDSYPFAYAKITQRDP